MDCLNITVNHWTIPDGRCNLDDLLNEAFAALALRWNKTDRIGVPESHARTALHSMPWGAPPVGRSAGG
ncbi:hypothetical protein [Streptomyces sp. cf124]|uniref:hypothetical protein n=1 Tax=Streptomyces sp. cf124 TaxID=1761903 RepID=UPI000B86F1A4|nr:hypothetical protein [Streptomyces sp. cf124]